MIIRTMATLIALVAATTNSTKPVNFSAVADATYAAAVSQAQQTDDAATAAAGNSYLHDLQRALAVALAAKDLTEANRIDLERKALQSKIGPASAPSGSDADTQPSPSAEKVLTGREADANYSRSMNAAKDAYDRTMESARQNYLMNLHAALNAAFDARSLDQANQIDAKIKSLQEPAAALPARVDASPKQSAVILPPGVSATELEQFAPQLRLAASLAGTTWRGMYDKEITFNGDGTGQSSTGRKFRWYPINDDQVFLIWNTLDADLLSFDADRKIVQKRWVGSSLKDAKTNAGRRVQTGGAVK